MLFGQLIVGPPGSGKTTYCRAISTLLRELGRDVLTINIDSANDELPYKADIDINELITLDDVMKTKNLGPNGALMFCMEYLEENLSWLLGKISNQENKYLLLDFPGQVELYTHHNSVKNIIKAFEKADIRLCSVYLVDMHYVNDAGKYVSALLMTLNSMIQMEVPTVNVLTKVDLIKKFGDKMDFGLEYYTEVADLDYILESLNANPLTKRYHRLNKAMADVVTDYSLVSFIPMSADDRTSLLNVMKAVDKANGYIFGSNEERNIQRLLSVASGAEWDHNKFGYARDTYGPEEQKNSDDDEEEILKLIATQNYKA